MRPTAGRTRGGIALGVACICAALVLPATASAREFSLWGHAVNAGECQSDVKVGFSVAVERSRFKYVDGFQAKDLNYPNTGLPEPFGKPTANCFPGEHIQRFQSLQGPNIGNPIILFDRDNPGHFSETSKFVIQGTVIEEWRVAGDVSVFRKRGEWRARASGWLVYEVSEAGIKWGGSSGKVHWVATGHAVNRRHG